MGANKMKQNKTKHTKQSPQMKREDITPQEQCVWGIERWLRGWLRKSKRHRGKEEDMWYTGQIR